MSAYSNTSGIGTGVSSWGGSSPQSSGMGGDLLQSLFQSLQNQTNSANAQNLKQYNGLLSSVNATKGKVNNLYGQELGQLNNAGTTEHALLDQQTQNQIGSADQNLVSRGLDNTTIAPSVNAGIQKNAGLQGQQIDQAVSQQRLGVLGQQAQGQMQLGQMTGDAILSRQNQTPDLSSYLGLIGQLGQNAGRQAGTPAASSGNAGWSANGFNPALAGGQMQYFR